MRVHPLFQGAYSIMAVMEGDTCPSVDFLTQGEEAYAASRAGLMNMIEHIATHGFEAAPQKWTHRVDEAHGIYELIKGDLRLFYFKGAGSCIAVTTGGLLKKSQKVNKGMVDAAVAWKQQYEAAVATGTLILDEMDNHEDQ